jgi:predicted ATPase with chaperone activity
MGLPVWPAIPDSLDDLGLPYAVINDLILRALWLHGAATVSSLQKALKLPFHVVETVSQQLRQQQLLEVKKSVGLNSTLGLTNAGRAQAAARMDVCQYVGPAPVSLDQYASVVEAQAAVVELTREQMRQAFHDLVMPDALLDQLGPSLIAHQSLFLYGDTGSGKTSIAERILRIYQDPVVIPYAVEVDGHIISILDPHVHKPAPFTGEKLDPRWVVCHRPCVKVGGELSADMLELRRDEVTRVFVAPCQVKANNGILIIDDFGRQVVSPKELLNRWIVPLDQHVDFLTISSGMKFQMPFELMLVFSTNVDPSDLVDEAFLRRVQTKVYVPDVSVESFDRIFDLVVETEQVPCDAGCAAYLRDRCLASGSRVLRACYPMDIYRLIKAISRYEGRPAAITTLNIDRAIELYFAKSGMMQQGKGWSAETQRQRAGPSLQSRPARREKTPI